MRERDPLRDLRGYAAHLEQSVDPTRARARVDAALRGPARPAWHRTVAATASAAVFFAVANVALAAAADPAAPGDRLYVVDRAYEAVTAPLGLAGDIALERMDEADVVAARGETATAIDLLVEALDQVDEAAGVRPHLTALGDDAGRVEGGLGTLLGLGRQVMVASHEGSPSGVAAAVAALEQAVTPPRDGQEPEPGTASPVTEPPQDAPPGRSGETPAVTAPGQSGGSPSATAPGQSGASPSATAPGQSGESPSATAPGQSRDGGSATAPGQGQQPPRGGPGGGGP